MTNVNRRDALRRFGIGLGFAAAAPYLLTEKEGMTDYRLGLNPSPEGALKLRLSDYLDPSKLPPLPAGDFGHQGYVQDWQMLGNDDVGDCAIAGPFHAEMLWNAVAGRSINVNTDCTIRAYSDITGYVPGDPNTDRGSNIATVSEYWCATGLTDASGQAHKIDAYVELHGLREVLYAIYLTDCVGIGVSFPQQWMDAFRMGSTWEALSAASIVGGHYILGVGWVSGYIDTITWGKQQLLSPAGLRQFGNTLVAYFSRERILSSGKDLNGFKLDELLDDFEALPNV